MLNTTRLICLQVKHYGGKATAEKRVAHHRIEFAFMRHRRRTWWALNGRHAPAHHPLRESAR